MEETGQWARNLGWESLVEEKVITKDRLGSYSVPRLLIHGTFGRVLLDPVAASFLACLVSSNYSRSPLGMGCWLQERTKVGNCFTMTLKGLEAPGRSGHLLRQRRNCS